MGAQPKTTKFFLRQPGYLSSPWTVHRDYVKGVVGLAKGLRQVRAAYPLVVVVPPDMPKEHRRMLEAQGCLVLEIEPVYPQNQTQLATVYYVINHSKLRIWEFVEYSKMVYLDRDNPRYTGKEANMQREDIKMLAEKWWAIYNEESLDYRKQPPAADAVLAEAVNMPPFIVALSEAGKMQHVMVPQQPSGVD